jgi:nucleoside-diphosphate-sugar epimerase
MISCGITGYKGVLGSKIIKNQNVKFIKFNGDIKSFSEVKKWIVTSKIEAIIHLAAIVPTFIVEKNYKEAKKVNFEGTKNLVDALNLLDHKVKWFFYASTSHVYSLLSSYKPIAENSLIKPSSKYGYTKYLAENYILKNLDRNIPYCIGRIFSFTSINQKEPFFIPSVINKLKSAKQPIVNFSNLNHYRDFINLDDLEHAILLLLSKKSSGIYNIGSGKKVYLKKIVIFLSKLLNKKVKISDNKKTSFLVANIDKLKKLGFKPQPNIFKIIKKLI